MTEIKPIMVDGEARCDDDCPEYEMGCPHSDDPFHQTCGPYYRATVAAQAAEIERLYESWHRQESRADAAEARAEQAEATVAAVRGDVEYLRDQIKNGLRENDDGTFTLMWTQKQIDDAKAEAERLWQFFGPAAPPSAEPTSEGGDDD